MNQEMKQCENQVVLFFRHLDDRRYDALVALLAPDAIWHRQGKVLTGPSAVKAALLQRSATMKIAHIITNLVFDKYETDRCEMRGYMLVIRHEPGVEIYKPAPLTGIESIRNMHIIMRRNVDQWLIAELTGEDIVFTLNN